MGKKYTFTEAQAENIAAIAFHIGTSPDWQAAYRAAADNMGGSVGLYQAALEMAVSLEEYASAKGIEWGDNADWIQTTEALSEKLIEFMLNTKNLPNPRERKDIVKHSIVRY